MKKITPIRILTFTFIFFETFLSYGQKQPGIPKPRGPVDLSETVNLVMFIILPALVVIGYFFWRNAMKKREKEKE